MKKLIILCITLATVALVGTTGCSKKSGVDTSKVESSFASAKPEEKGDVEKAVAAAKSGDYATALATIQKVGAKVKLTPEQEAAIKELVEQLQKQVAEVANKAAGDVQKSATDLQKSLGK